MASSQRTGFSVCVEAGSVFSSESPLSLLFLFLLNPLFPDFASPRVIYTLLCLPIAEITSVGYTLKTLKTRPRKQQIRILGIELLFSRLCGRHLSGNASSPALRLCLGAHVKPMHILTNAVLNCFHILTNSSNNNYTNMYL